MSIGKTLLRALLTLYLLEGHFTTFCPLEGHSRGHLIKFSQLVGHFMWHFTPFCPLEGHSEGHLTTLCLLKGQFKGHFVMFYVLEGHLTIGGILLQFSQWKVILKSIFFTFSLLEGHSKGYFKTCSPLEGHSRVCGCYMSSRCPSSKENMAKCPSTGQNEKMHHVFWRAATPPHATGAIFFCSHPSGSVGRPLMLNPESL